jgi:hypothetical protein
VAALDVPGATAPTMWRPSATRRYSCLALTTAAVAVAVAVVVTGPPRPVAFDVRLPLVVLALGALRAAALWRRRVIAAPGELVVRSLLRTRRIPLANDGVPAGPELAAGPGIPGSVPMVTPWLVLTATAGIAALTIRGLTERPALASVVLTGGIAVCFLSLGGYLLSERAGRGSAVVAEGRFGKRAGVVLKQAPAGAAQAKH